MSRKKHEEHDEELERLRKENERLTRLADDKLHPVLHYNLRTIGLVATLFAGAAMTQGLSFGWSAILLTIGLLLLAVDPWLEPSMRPFKNMKIINTALWGGILLAFYVFIVFVPSGFTVSADTEWGNYPLGTIVGSKEWDSRFTQLRVTIGNPTNHDYTDVDVTIIPDFALVKSWQDTDFSQTGCFFISSSQPIVEQSILSKRPDGSIVENPLQQQGVKLTHGEGVRIRCPLLPKGSMTRIVFALIDDGQSRGSGWTTQILPKKLSKSVAVSGTYKSVMGQEHGFSQAVIPRVPPSLP